MKSKMQTLVMAMIGLLTAVGMLQAVEKSASTKQGTLEIMQKVADWQLAHPSKFKPTSWTNGALCTGMMALGDISADPKYRDAMMALGRSLNWKLGRMVYHPDDSCIGQTYCELYSLYRDPAMLVSLRERFDYILAHPSKGKVDEKFPAEGIPAGIMRWWLCDVLFMGPPGWIRCYGVTGEKQYLDFMLQEWQATADHLFDKEEHLFYRDKRYFDKREANGKKVFWSRGNGWVMGGLVRLLQILPSNHPKRPWFIEKFRQMADRLADCQQEDGLWRASLLDPENYPAPETSGSSFHCYALTWGVNQGLLDRAKFEPIAQKAWAGLVKCVNPDGKLIHVQPVAGSPYRFDPNSTANYAVGAFLLAGSEQYRMHLLQEVPNATIRVTNDLDQFRPQETVEISLADLQAKLPQVTAENVAVMSSDAARWITSQLTDADGDGRPETLLFQTDLLPDQKKEFTVFAGIDRTKIPAPALKTTARFVPERYDDFAWENDRIAFRMYGPALVKHDGPANTGSGIDVWCKHVRRPLVDALYKSGRYHVDNGRGVDCYKVGAARGCGGTAVWAQDKLWTSGCFEKWKVLEKGPIRSVFELTYAAWDAAGRKVSEVKRISLDLGSNLNRMESTFHTSGTGPLQIAAGLTIHKGGKVSHGENWATVWERTDGKDNGMLGLGLVMPDGTFKQIKGNALFLKQVEPGKSLTYYAGAGWSKGLDFKDRESWNAYVEHFLARLKSPLKVEVL
ncbi:MAG: DUF4861 family protein [Pirellulales bacterium]|nr:DUF4861 family protein [Pirellulales bacterium]